MKFGVLGYGKLVREQLAHAFALTDNPIVAVGSRSGHRPDGFPGRVHSSYQACIDDPNVEAIYIATPNHLHVPLSIAAMKAGKPVLCEKPISMTLDEHQDLETCQQATGQTLMEAMMVEHHPQWEQVKTLKLGAHPLLNASFTYGPRKTTDVRSKAELGGGVWLDIGCYPLYACYALGARNIADVRGECILENGVPIRVVAQIKFAEGLTGQIQVTSQHFRQQRLTVTTDQGRLTLPRPFNPEGPTDNLWETDNDTIHLSAEANQYALMIEHFVKHADSGEYLFRDRSKTLASWSDQIRGSLAF